MNTFHPKTGLDILQVLPVSKAQARQRTGRAGRETSGVCYRLYTEEQFDELKEMTTPEIQRCNLASVALQLMALVYQMFFILTSLIVRHKIL
ncbi:Putative ATP-dependent RNA helicase dhx33 [Desmophyllum pertusum]|uniref:RNA helicase n=1 Tax=Desmophyllum pertusum TaxID=174260 RepID=A0A9X0D2Y1_9CNID|nr:Putative ATP-dependent RNA helicase dhx33 [Desmophyllum pertusum]